MACVCVCLCVRRAYWDAVQLVRYWAPSLLDGSYFYQLLTFGMNNSDLGCTVNVQCTVTYLYPKTYLRHKLEQLKICHWKVVKDAIFHFMYIWILLRPVLDDINGDIERYKYCREKQIVLRLAFDELRWKYKYFGGLNQKWSNI